MFCKKTKEKTNKEGKKYNIRNQDNYRVIIKLGLLNLRNKKF